MFAKARLKIKQNQITIVPSIIFRTYHLKSLGDSFQSITIMETVHFVYKLKSERFGEIKISLIFSISLLADVKIVTTLYFNF